MVKSVSRFGGSPSIFSRKTFAKSWIAGMFSKIAVFSLVLEYPTYTTYIRQPFLTHFPNWEAMMGRNFTGFLIP